MAPCVVRFLGVTALLCSFVARTSAAQDQRHPRWEIPGFDFRKDGVWRTKARAVRAMRRQLRASGRFTELNAPVARVAPLSQVAGPQPSPTVVSGVLKVPAILFRYKDSPAPTFDTAAYNAVLFGATPAGAAAGRPYTYRSFYNELSNGLFDIQGQTFGYATLDSNEVYYVGGQSSTCASQNPYGSPNCNGLFSNFAISRMQSALTEALQQLDAQIDFSQYVDPTSGFVPLVLFMHEAMGGECGPSATPQNHLWAHRFSVPTFTTQDNDPFHAGQKVKISDYILQPGVGGASSCNTSQIMPIGTVAHETGHGFGLPDLYDTQGGTEGIGQWGLMSSGSFTSALSPARMESWSLSELGWITIVPLTVAESTYTFDAAPLSDTAFYVAVKVIDDANLLHMRREEVVDRIKTLLQTDRRSDGGSKNDRADCERSRCFNEGEALKAFTGVCDFHFLVPFEMMDVICSLRARLPKVISQEVATSTCTRVDPRLVAVESTVTVPFGERVNCVTPLAVG